MAADPAAPPPARPGILLLGRATAALTLLSSVLHLAAIGSHGVLRGAVLAAMALACLGCLDKLWKRPAAHVFGFVAAMALTMLAAHGSLLGSGSHDHHATTSSPTALDPLTACTLGVAAAEAMLALIAVFLTTDHRAPPATPPTAPLSDCRAARE